VKYNNDVAFSSAQAVLILVAITFILAALVLLMTIPLPHLFSNPTVPAIFVITDIRHTDKFGQMNEEGWVVLKNSGPGNYQNWNLFALTYVNGNKIPAEIPTLNAYQLAHTVNHHGVHLLDGLGSSGTREKHNAVWVSGASLAIDFNNHCIKPGDEVTIEIYNVTSGEIISRDTYPHTEESNQEKMMNLYLSRQGV